MIKKSTSWTIFIYGAIIIGLGYLGYHQSQSKASLISGGISGTFLLISSLLMFSQKKIGSYMSLIVTALLTGVFSYRYALTKATIPAILAVISAGVLIFLFTQLGRWKK